jgi:SAM-dependent methyltransferase
MNKHIWPLKIIAKIVLSRLPIPYKFWKSLGLFEHGQMNKASYALKIFRIHRDKAFPNGLPPRFTFMELGPGDSIASALVAYAHGAEKIILVDVGDYADKDVALYQSIARDLKKEGLNAPNLESAKNFTDVLKACNAEYFTGGLQSLQKIPDDSADMIYSHSVLEHVRKADFDATMRELARIVKPEGRVTHSIDLKDHLAYALNNLRFPEKIWESDFFANSGFYTNRLRSSEILASVRNAGFDILFSDSGNWPELPTPRSKMAAPFRNMSDEDLYIRTMHLVLQSGSAAETQKVA